MIIRYTPAARADLKEMRNYISNVLKNPTAAKNISMRILKNISILKDYPLCGISLNSKIERDTDLRYLICGNYIAFYRIKNDAVSVIRILDGRTDYMNALFSTHD